MADNRSEMEELFLRKKPVKLLMSLKTGGGVGGKYVSVLSKETDCTYSHTVKLLEEFRNLGIVSFDKQGRVKYIKLTSDGEDLASNFEIVLRKFTKLKSRIKQTPKQVEMKKEPQVTKTAPKFTTPIKPPAPQDLKKK